MYTNAVFPCSETFFSNYLTAFYAWMLTISCFPNIFFPEVDYRNHTQIGGTYSVVSVWLLSDIVDKRTAPCKQCHHDYHIHYHSFSLRPILESKSFRKFSLFTLILKNKRTSAPKTSVLYAPPEITECDKSEMKDFRSCARNDAPMNYETERRENIEPVVSNRFRFETEVGAHVQYTWRHL
jgi:hypothetical protein